MPISDLEARCRVCGCTDEDGCEEGCSWVEEDLCSSCEVKVERYVFIVPTVVDGYVYDFQVPKRALANLRKSGVGMIHGGFGTVKYRGKVKL